jgi:hypothetical protein
MKPKLKPPGTKRLKLTSDTLLSNSAFKFNWRRYTPVLQVAPVPVPVPQPVPQPAVQPGVQPGVLPGIQPGVQQPGFAPGTGPGFAPGQGAYESTTSTQPTLDVLLLLLVSILRAPISSFTLPEGKSCSDVGESGRSQSD